MTAEDLAARWPLPDHHGERDALLAAYGDPARGYHDALHLTEVLDRINELTGAGASSLAPERFATGAAVLTMGRQIGVALGVAVLVAVLGTSATDFHTAWLITVVGGLAAGLALAAIGPPALNAAGVDGPARPVISEAIADPLIAEPLIAEEAA